MELTARHNPHAPQVVEVLNGDPLKGGVVYRFNTGHRIGSRTKHEGPKPSIKAIRAAIATLA
jgi:hypothetical protein